MLDMMVFDSIDVTNNQSAITVIEKLIAENISFSTTFKVNKHNSELCIFSKTNPDACMMLFPRIFKLRFDERLEKFAEAVYVYWY